MRQPWPYVNRDGWRLYCVVYNEDNLLDWLDKLKFEISAGNSMNELWSKRSVTSCPSKWSFYRLQNVDLHQTRRHVEWAIQPSVWCIWLLLRQVVVSYQSPPLDYGWFVLPAAVDRLEARRYLKPPDGQDYLPNKETGRYGFTLVGSVYFHTNNNRHCYVVLFSGWNG